MLKTLITVLVVAGGAYALHKTKPQFFPKIGAKFRQTGVKIKESFLEGYTEVVEAR